jgi:hypothetical protein
MDYAKKDELDCRVQRSITHHLMEAMVISSLFRPIFAMLPLPPIATEVAVVRIGPLSLIRACYRARSNVPCEAVAECYKTRYKTAKNGRKIRSDINA